MADSLGCRHGHVTQRPRSTISGSVERNRYHFSRWGEDRKETDVKALDWTQGLKSSFILRLGGQGRAEATQDLSSRMTKDLDQSPNP